MFTLEVITVPVSDVDRALRFYVDQVGFRLDVDYRPTETFRVVQLTPPGAACSVQFGTGIAHSAPGTLSGIFLVVTDIRSAREQLLNRGVSVGDIRHKIPTGAWDGRFASGIDPARGDYASFCDFNDPDGNVWVVQERGFHAT